MKSTVWREPNFFPLWLGAMLSSVADSTYYIVLAWFVLEITHSAANLGTTLLMASLPRLLFMIFGGVAVDRLNPRRVMVVSLTARMAILLGLAVWLATKVGALDLWVLYAVAGMFGVVDAFYWPTQNALVPHVLPDQVLATGNSFIQTTQQLSMVVGPLVAGGMLQWHQFAGIFTVLAALYAGSAVAIRAIHMTAKERVIPLASRSVWGEIYDGVRYVWNIRILLFLMLASMVINLFFMGPVNIGLPSFVQRQGWSGSVYGYFEAAMGLGAVVGGALTVAVRGMRGHFQWIALAAAVIGLGLIGAAMVHQWPMGIVFLAASGIAMSLTNIPIITYIQTIVDHAMMGRVMSLLTLMSVGLVPVSYGMSSLILRMHWLGPASLMIVGGAIIALFCAMLWFQPDFRQMESHPRWQQAKDV
ncbi:MFS transporter [Sulfobacillus sp. hq2]|uniref:MFS transporter n=1 Tax=Sulfobacillus TaxID=28033 RepID=UPI000CD0EC5C|nr:MFS transporter [Sulfobacillus sp. hq2]POB11583.1 hypothetical protein CO251_04315 [Sulfobacillus sp. hq2]